MNKQWIGCAPENFRQGRQNFQPEAIVMHIIVGSLQSAAAHFNDPSAAVSAHYGVGKNGTVHQYVDEADTAFHAGITVNASWKLIKPGVNPNLYTIGIEHEGQADDPWGDTLYNTSAALVAEVAARWHIPLDADHLVLHREIRASKTCPGSQFDRDELLRRARLAAAALGHAPAAPATSEVRLIANTNLREGAPSTQARVVHTLSAGTEVEVVGFTDTGERVRGNSHWYQTADNNFFWAGNTDMPQPVREAVPAPVPLPAEPAAGTPAPVLSGIVRLDALFMDEAVPAIGLDDNDRAAVGAVQDLLTGHGYRGLPNLLAAAYGTFKSKTTDAVRDFQQQQPLPATGAVDVLTLKQLVRIPALEPRATQAYLTLVLKRPYQGMQKILSLIAQMEGVGKFGALNLNTDNVGLAYGLIQWAQRPGRLPELLTAFANADRDRYVAIFGDGNPTVADRLIAHVKQPNGGVHPKTGVALNPAFDLIREPWVARFTKATAVARFQQVQVDVALTVFTSALLRIRQFAPEIVSERGVAFMIDVANQFGNRGLERLYTNVQQPNMTEMDILEDIADATVAAMPDTFKHGARARRDGFLNTPLLSNEPFQDAPGGNAPQA